MAPYRELVHRVWGLGTIGDIRDLAIDTNHDRKYEEKTVLSKSSRFPVGVRVLQSENLQCK